MKKILEVRLKRVYDLIKHNNLTMDIKKTENNQNANQAEVEKKKAEMQQAQA